MTSAERKLSDMLMNARTRLYKYYNPDEKREPNVPDILDYLDALINKMEDKIKELSEQAVQSYYATGRTDFDMYAINSNKKLLSKLEKQYDEIAENPNEYYFVEELAWNELNITPIQCQTLPVQTPYTEEGKLLWRDTGETQDVYIWSSTYNTFTIPCNAVDDNIQYRDGDFFSRHMIFHMNQRYVGFTDWQKTETPNGTKFRTCKTQGCDAIFPIFPAEQSLFARKQFSLPTHCIPHRSNKNST